MSLEVSPLLADDTAATVAQAKALHARAGCPNLFIKIPGNRAGIPAIEESIAAGIPINVTLLFSTEQCLAAADAYRRGIERRLAAKMNPVRSGRFAVRQPLGQGGRRCGSAEPPQSARHRGGAASLPSLATDVHGAGLAAPCRRRRAGAAPALGEHRTKDPAASDVLYVEALAAPIRS